MDRPDDQHELAQFADALRTLTRELPVRAVTGGEPSQLSAFYQAMVEADLRESMRELELPHILVCFDPKTGCCTVEGPFESGLEASAMAEFDAAADQVNRTGLRYLVLPLLPRRDQAPSASSVRR